MKRIVYLCSTNDDFTRSFRNKHAVPHEFQQTKPGVSTHETNSFTLWNSEYHRLKLAVSTHETESTKGLYPEWSPKNIENDETQPNNIGNKNQEQFIAFDIFFAACVVCTDGARLVRHLCQARISVYRARAFFFLMPCPVCHRRPVHCAKHCRCTSLPRLCALHPQTEVETHLAGRCKVPFVGVRMVLSGMGAELLAKELLRTDTHPLYRLHPWYFSKIYGQLYREPE